MSITVLGSQSVSLRMDTFESGEYFAYLFVLFWYVIVVFFSLNYRPNIFLVTFDHYNRKDVPLPLFHFTVVS